jgi:class 3 adenylate cyclase/tetratricopeptide (TPR) repeat protein
VAGCPSCGKDLPGEFPFCPFCGAPLRGTDHEQRKAVTALFCDVTGSTGLGESTDPEALRALLARYFDRMRGIVEGHGGTVEKFIGDAVMAVFGVPAAHEDDALRACRAALEMRDALPELGVKARIGVNTGEVVTGTAERLATGDAVNVAARLEQAAEPGTILIGEETLRLVRDAVEVDAIDPLQMKGKSAPVSAYLLLRVTGDLERSHASRFVGREPELAALHRAWERSLSERRCEFVTVLGEPGVGKSRLVAEALASLDARVVRGRCLPYGEGITYWPVVELVKQLDALPSDPSAAAAVRSLLGQSDEGTSADQIAWAFRKLLEEQAPLIVVLDDIQWGEETFLDLVEASALLTSGAPLLLLCTARLDLLDRRASWPGVVRLEPLSEEEVDELIRDEVSDELRGRIAHAAGGNPLFISEMLAMAHEQEDVEVPPTLKALLAARLDQLDEPERRVLERGSVEGELFHRGAVQALVPEESQVTARLTSLVRRELVRPDRAQLAGDDGFRFRHLLIRDAAYEAVPKSVRAELHERFADWLVSATELVELDEIVGYHLEQAVRHRQELGQPAEALALRAGERLAAAGRLALWREDRRAARRLLKRALDLTRPLRLDVLLEVDLAATLFIEDSRSGAAIVDAAAERAAAEGDAAGEAFARAMGGYHRFNINECSADELETLLLTALPLLEQEADHAALVYVWEVFAISVANARSRWVDAARASEQALEHARLASQQRTGLFWIELALALGPTPAAEALEQLDRLLPATPAPYSLFTRAWLLAMLDRFDDAVPLARESNQRQIELDGRRIGEIRLAEIARMAGDHETAARHLETACAWLEEREQLGLLGTYVFLLGRELCALGRFDEAEALARRGRELVRDRPRDEAWWCQVQARVLAHRSEHAEAEHLAREAVASHEESDSLTFQGDAWCDLAEVLAAAGRDEEAAAAFDEALERYERKQNIPLARQVRTRLSTLRGQPPSPTGETLEEVSPGEVRKMPS